MKYLESIKLVQFFLFEKQEIRLQEITGIFGPNASGKSSLVDAVQIAMFGANSRLVSLNAQADERTTTRTIRSYCLGMHDETKRARDNATTYITLLWRDSVTNEPTTMGVCLYASLDTEGHEVRGRYIVPGVELAMQDHLEIVDGQERPRAWETFRHQLVERSKISGEDPFFPDSERYIRAALLTLRGAGSAPSFEAFKSAFKFALRMRFDKSIDNIVRHDVLEARPTNIQKFKEVTESFRKLAQMVAQVKAKIEDGEKVEAEFNKASAASVRSITWGGLSRLAASQDAVERMNRANEAKQIANDSLMLSEESLVQVTKSLKDAESKENLNRELRINHASHQKNGTLKSEIERESVIEGNKTKDVRDGLNLIRRTLADSANSIHLMSNAPALKEVIKAIDSAFPSSHELSKEQLSLLLKPALKEATRAMNDLLVAGTTVARHVEESKKSLEINASAMLRVKEGRSVLSNETERLLAELRDNGLHSTPVCDLVRITDPEWQHVIEAYLGRNVEALLVEGNEEKAAFSLYRGLTGPRAIYGAKIVAASKQNNMAAGPGTVAELIEGENPAAVAYLRRRFGDMLRAKTDAEALIGSRTLTQDGMIVQSGEYDRIRPTSKGHLKIGGGDGSQKQDLLEASRHLEEEVRKLEALQEEIKRLFTGLGNIASESSVMKYMIEACDAMHTSKRIVASLSQQLGELADVEYIHLGELEALWKANAHTLRSDVAKLNSTIGGQEVTLAECIRQEISAINRWTSATSEANTAVENPEYDRDFALIQWDVLLEKYKERYQEAMEYCIQQERESKKTMDNAIARGSRELGTFKEKYREQGSVNADDWRNERKWVGDLLKRLRDTELSEFEEQMKDVRIP